MVHKRENRVKAGSRRSKNTWNGGEGVKGRGGDMEEKGEGRKEGGGEEDKGGENREKGKEKKMEAVQFNLVPCTS